MIRQGVYQNPIEDIAEINSTKEAMEALYSEDRFQMFDSLPDLATSSAEVKRFKPDVVFDDYIQLIQPERGQDQRRLQLEKIVHEYKWLAKSQNCVAILLSQLNRMMETRGDTRPRLSDLAESGAIEQVAENVFFVFYEWKVSQTSGAAHSLELIASKVRYGVSGILKLGYAGDKVKIYCDEEAWYADNKK
jgi:replicative DNA helicase